MSRYLKVAALGVAVLFALGTCVTARADTVTITLNVANANLSSQGSGPYGQVVISGSDTSWSATATGLNGFVFGDGGILALNLNSSATLTPITGFCQVGVDLGCNGNNQEDGFGDFTFKLNDGSGFSSPYTTFAISFTTSGSFADVSHLLSSTLPSVAGHLGPASNTACTGFAANGGTGSGTIDNAACTSTPEPGSMTLLGAGVLSLVGLVTRKRFR